MIALRALRPEDAEAVARGLASKDTVQWLSTVPWPYTVEHARDWIANHATAQDKAITFDGGFVGTMRVGEDLGYWLDPEWRGRGIVTRAASGWLAQHFAQSDAPVTAGHFLGNVPSRKVLLRLGFVDTHHDTVTRVMDGQTVTRQRMILTGQTFRPA